MQVQKHIAKKNANHKCQKNASTKAQFAYFACFFIFGHFFSEIMFVQLVRCCFFPLWQFIIFNDETRTRVSDKHVLYTVPLHTFVVITRKTQVSEWALGLQRGRLFIFLGCLVVYMFLSFFCQFRIKGCSKTIPN